MEQKKKESYRKEQIESKTGTKNIGTMEQKKKKASAKEQIESKHRTKL
jgi:hypothetical protein